MKGFASATLLVGDLRAGVSLVVATGVHALAFTLEPQGTALEATTARHEAAMLLDVTPVVENFREVAEESQPPERALGRPLQPSRESSERAQRVVRETIAAPPQLESVTSERADVSDLAARDKTLVGEDSVVSGVVAAGASSTDDAPTVGAAQSVQGAAGRVDSERSAGPQGARLLTTGDPCAGYFPSASPVSKGTVKVRVDVDSRGLVTRSAVLLVTPEDSGLFQAALACASRLQFVAAKTREGQAVPSQATLSLNFKRH